GGDRESGDPADPRGSHQQRDVAMIGARTLQPALDLRDPPLDGVWGVVALLGACKIVAPVVPLFTFRVFA
ncbi:MAG TPA: hypothetical protein VGH93_01485, partial [Solirubrobacteraceae bacterium]